MAGGGVFGLTVAGRAGRLGASPLSKRFGGSCEKAKQRRSEGTGDHSNLCEFGHVDKPGEVFEVRTFVVKFSKVVVL